MLKVYETLRDFDGMDEGQHFWYLGWYDEDCGRMHKMHAVTDEGDDAERLIRTWLIENTDYVAGHGLDLIDDDGNIGRLGVMMRTDETVRSMLEEVIEFVRANQHRDWFTTDDDWWAGLRSGRRCVSIPDAPSGRDEYHYKCGVVEGMCEKLARMTGAEFGFIDTWLIPEKTDPMALAKSAGS